jgi:hypothetical protein
MSSVVPKKAANDAGFSAEDSSSSLDGSTQQRLEPQSNPSLERHE